MVKALFRSLVRLHRHEYDFDLTLSLSLFGCCLLLFPEVPHSVDFSTCQHASDWRSAWPNTSLSLSLSFSLSLSLKCNFSFFEKYAHRALQKWIILFAFHAVAALYTFVKKHFRHAWLLLTFRRLNFLQASELYFTPWQALILCCHTRREHDGMRLHEQWFHGIQLYKWLRSKAPEKARCLTDLLLNPLQVMGGKWKMDSLLYLLVCLFIST